MFKKSIFLRTSYGNTIESDINHHCDIQFQMWTQMKNQEFMEYKPQDAMFNIDCNGEYVKNHKTLIIVRCRHLEINSYHGYKDPVVQNWKLVDMWSIISRIFFRTSMEMQSYNAWRSIVVWRFNFVPTSVQEAIGFKSLAIKIEYICCDRKRVQWIFFVTRWAIQNHVNF